MPYIKPVLFIILLFSIEYCRGNELDIYTATALTTTWIDYKQSVEIQKQGIRESNLCTGNYPSMRRLNLCFLGSTVGYITLSRILPKDLGVKFLQGVTLNELFYIKSNVFIGVEIKLN